MSYLNCLRRVVLLRQIEDQLSLAMFVARRDGALFVLYR